MQIGDVVIPANKDVVLACGSGWYTHAIVASIEPFILVSECGDMLWEGEHNTDYTALCQAHPDIVKVVSKRVIREKDMATQTLIRIKANKPSNPNAETGKIVLDQAEVVPIEPEKQPKAQSEEEIRLTKILISYNKYMLEVLKQQQKVDSMERRINAVGGEINSLAREIKKSIRDSKIRIIIGSVVGSLFATVCLILLKALT